VLRIARHETVALDTGGSIDLIGCEALWSPTRRGRRIRAIVFGMVAVAFAVGGLADSVTGDHNSTPPLVIAAIAGAIALHQTVRALVTYLVPNEPGAWELLVRTPQGRLLTKEVVSAGPAPNLLVIRLPGPIRTAWREVSPPNACLWLHQRSRSDERKLFPELATAPAPR
jgi:hypothetical protein